jgi:hypothetical protein
LETGGIVTEPEEWLDQKRDTEEVRRLRDTRLYLPGWVWLALFFVPMVGAAGGVIIGELIVVSRWYEQTIEPLVRALG